MPPDHSDPPIDGKTDNPSTPTYWLAGLQFPFTFTPTCEQDQRAKGEQNAPFLGLPPELRLSIYDFVGTPKSVLLRVEQVVGTGSRLRFLPLLPPLYYTSRLTYREYPLRDYYRDTVFFFTNNMLTSRALDAFVATCGLAVHAMTSVKINIAPTLPSMRAFAGENAFVHFSMRKGDDGDLTVVLNDCVGWWLCFCKVRQLAQEEIRRGGSLMMLLRAIVGHYESVNRLVDEAGMHLVTRICSDCGEFKFILWSFGM
ncbi:hypothetical protein LTR17_016043 [Elasticomyces elasticus]|nr:hypothetical protein LTR17_016043 [Elasticomyces elasticus]